MNRPPVPAVRVACDRDGPVRVPYSALTIRVCIETRDAEYRFRCPDCGQVVVQQIHPALFHSLCSQPITVEWYRLPLELADVRRRVAPPLTVDDLAEFRRELSDL